MKKLLVAAAPYLTLIVLSLLYCAPLFSGRDGHDVPMIGGRGDWDQFTFRRLTPRLAMLRDHQLPLWNPYVNGGNVLLAHPHDPAFSPWYLPTLIFGAELGARIEVLLLVILGTTGMAALLRQWKVSRAGSLLGGLLLMTSAHFTLHIAEGHVEWCALGLIPWAMLCLVRGAACTHGRRNWRYLPAGAAVIASALLDGSVYILAVFLPLLVLWAVLESIRTRSWPIAVRTIGMIFLALLLGAVVLLPRVEFVAANPRPVDRINCVAPAAFPAMFLDPDQADLFRATRDMANPPRDELAGCLSLPSPALTARSDWQWRRLDVELSTTSDWADVRFSGVTYVLRFGKDTVENIPSEQLDATAPSTEGLAIKNNPLALANQPEVLVEEIPEGARGPAGQSRRAVLQATLYVHRSRWNSLHVAITRGDEGMTHLVLRQAGTIVADFRASGRIYDDRTNRQTYDVSMQTLTNGGLFRGKWIKLHVQLRTSSDWARLEVPGVPYLLAVEAPAQEADWPTPCSTQPLELRSPSPGRKTVSARAILCVPYPENDDLHLVIHQGVQGRSRLDLAAARERISAIRDDRNGEKGQRLVDYTLSRVAIQNLFEPLAKPWRWQLDEWEMTDGWHEYACYLTWLGLALALCGGIAMARRHWPLLAVGCVALLIAMGAALPVDLWSIIAQLPLYGSLQVSARFLVVVVFVLAVCAGFGLDWLGRWVERFRIARLRRLIEVGVVLIVYYELALLTWSVFPEVFVCRMASVPAHDAFAQRYATDDVRRAAMYSAHCPYAQANSGVLRDYENIAVPRGDVRLESDPAYRGEAYLQDGHGTARIAAWTMSRVTVDTELTAPDQCLLNQNFFSGWKARVYDAAGHASRQPVVDVKGLVGVELQPGDCKVEFYYLPDSFLWGAWISALTVVGCLGVCFSAKAGDWPAALAGCSGCVRGLVRSRMVMLAVGVLGLNLPFLLCHPAWPLVNLPAVRALAVALVLLVLPGWPLAAALVRRGWLAWESPVAMIAVSMSLFTLLIVGLHLTGIAPQPATLWNATWIIANLGLLVAAMIRPGTGAGRHPGQVPRQNFPNAETLPGNEVAITQPASWIALPIFVATFLMYAHAATSIVPQMDDHDYETQGTAYGLVHDLVPKLLTDRHTTYYFAHPPLLHACVAGSFLYWNELDDLNRYEAAWKRNQAATEGRLTEKPLDEFWRLPDGPTPADLGTITGTAPGRESATRHRIVGIGGSEYRVEPPLAGFGAKIPVNDLEVQLLYDRYHHDPHALATRTPNIFFAALTVALLAAWIAQTTGRPWLALLVAAVYATTPETFVRSSYGGYFAISQLALLEILLAVETWNLRSENSPLSTGEGQGVRAFSNQARRKWPLGPGINGLIAGGFAALACHKLVFLPAAIFVCQAIQADTVSLARRFLRAAMHPVVLGFALGTLLYWIYGLSIDAGIFWQDHVRTHLIDRVLHENPLNYGGYPSPAGLWLEFCRHTGYFLLPLGVLSIGMLEWQRRKTPEGLPATVREILPVWICWMALLSIAFTLIDWRQTKHLCPLLLPLAMAPAAWAGTGRAARLAVAACMAVLLLWNLGTLRALAADFAGFHVSPAW